MRTSLALGSATLSIFCLLLVGCGSDSQGGGAQPQQDAGPDSPGADGGRDANEGGSDVEVDVSEDVTSDVTQSDVTQEADPADVQSDPDAALPPGPHVFVHPDGVDVAGGGSASAPFRTIQFAVDNSSAPGSVLVAAGTYAESVIMRADVSIYGGFDADDWQDRDNRAWGDPTYETRVEAALNIAFTAGLGIGPETILDGFSVHGGVDKQDHHSYGVYLYDGGSPTISNNTIEGGKGDIYGNGIGIFGSASVIDGNVIRGGDAEIVYGIRSGNQSTPLIINNVILGDTAVDVSYGITLNNSSPRIMNNTIDGGSGGNESYGVFLFGTCAPEIDNNVVYATGGVKRFGIFEFSMGSTPVSLRSNDIFGCPDALYRDFEGSPHALTDVAQINALTDTTASGNVSVDPAFVSSADRHLQASSPAEVRQGGLDLSAEGYSDDQDDRPRTAPWSMGAFELD